MIICYSIGQIRQVFLLDKVADNVVATEIWPKDFMNGQCPIFGLANSIVQVELM